MSDPSCQHFPVPESQKAADDCWLGTPKSCRKTAGAEFRIPLDGVENYEVVDCVGASRPRLIFKVRVSFFKTSELALDRAKKKVVPSPNVLSMF